MFIYTDEVKEYGHYRTREVNNTKGNTTHMIIIHSTSLIGFLSREAESRATAITVNAN